MPKLFGKETQEMELNDARAPEAEAPTDTSEDDDRNDDRKTPADAAGRKARDTDTLGRFMAQLEGMEDEAVVECVRYRRQGGTELVQKWALESFDPYEIQKVWGGGKYLLRVRDAEGNYLKQATIHVAGKSKNPDASGPTDNGSTLELVQGMRQEFKDLLGQLRNPPAAANEHNSIELALSIVGAFQAAQAPYLEALLQKTKTGPDSGELLDLFFRGMEAAREMNPPSDPMAAVATQLAVPLLSQLQGGTPPGARQVKANPPETPATADTPRRPPWDILLSPWLHHLQSWAAKRKDPQMRALFVVDEIPDEAVQIFGEQLERGDAFLAEFFALHPETRPFENWYREFWAAIGGALSWEENDPETPEIGQYNNGEPPPWHAETPFDDNRNQELDDEAETAEGG